MSLFSTLRAELLLWQQNNQHCNLWWRDDDATHDTPALQKLIELHKKTQIPVALAVIPKFAHESLLQQITPYSQISILQHGWQHKNYETADKPCSEFGATRSQLAIRTDLENGIHALRAMFASRFVMGFVAPWNSIAPTYWPEFQRYDFVSFHDGAVNQAATEIKQINIHIDILRWRNKPRFRGKAKILRNFIRQLKQRRISQNYHEPIGIMSHHLVMDNASWQFLSQLFEFLKQQPAVKFLDIQKLARPWASNDNNPALPIRTKIQGALTAKVAVASKLIF